MSTLPVLRPGPARHDGGPAPAAHTTHPDGFTVLAVDCVPVSYPTAAQARHVASQLAGSPLVVPNAPAAFTVKAYLTADRPAAAGVRRPSNGPHMSVWPPLPEIGTPQCPQ
jgi:hypothetical protein